jgi:hypothetical protein
MVAVAIAVAAATGAVCAVVSAGLGIEAGGDDESTNSVWCTEFADRIHTCANISGTEARSTGSNFNMRRTRSYAETAENEDTR